MNMNIGSESYVSGMKYVCILVWLYLEISPYEVRAQYGVDKKVDENVWNFDQGKEDKCSLGSFFSCVFTPQIITETTHIRTYILDEQFQSLRNRYGDMRAIDAIYLKSLRIAEYNIPQALFLSFMAVLEHQKVSLKMPIFKSVTIPLTFERDSIFSARINHLPVQVYNDSPQSPEGDRDKLQHFFGSAYLAYISEAPDLTRTLGNLIEWGESQLIVGGMDDPRDKRANMQGECFGWDLLAEETLLPSDYLIFYTEGRK
jgi:hypothetical protein